MAKKLTFIYQDFENGYITEVYHDEDGKRYDFIYECVNIKTQDADGNWVEFDDEYEVV